MLKELAYYDGVYGTPEEVKVPFNDRVHFFGDGVYDATVGANGKVYLLQDHLDRFYSSAKALDIRIPMEKTELGSLLTACWPAWRAAPTLSIGRSPAASTTATTPTRTACPASCG